MKSRDSILDKIEIAKPCQADWEKMTGNERERACQLCHLNVYNISTMTSKEAESFLQERMPKGRVCVRLYRRADGTIITDNCPKGLRAARDAARLLTKRVAAAASLLITVLAGASGQAQNADNKGTPMMGKIARPLQGEPAVTPIMGDLAMPAPVMGAPVPISSTKAMPAHVNATTGVVMPIPKGLDAYTKSVESKIPSLSLPPGSGTIAVEFKIDVYGTVSDIKVNHSSGDTKLDKVACDLIRNAAPSFGKLPESITTMLLVHHTFK